MKIKKILFTVFFAATLLITQNTYINAASGMQKVVRQGDNIFISFRYKLNTDMHILIGKCGVNKINVTAQALTRLPY